MNKFNMIVFAFKQLSTLVAHLYCSCLFIQHFRFAFPRVHEKRMLKIATIESLKPNTVFPQGQNQTRLVDFAWRAYSLAVDRVTNLSINYNFSRACCRFSAKNHSIILLITFLSMCNICTFNNPICLASMIHQAAKRQMMFLYIEL